MSRLNIRALERACYLFSFSVCIKFFDKYYEVFDKLFHNKAHVIIIEPKISTQRKVYTLYEMKKHLNVSGLIEIGLRTFGFDFIDWN